MARCVLVVWKIIYTTHILTQGKEPMNEEKNQREKVSEMTPQWIAITQSVNTSKSKMKGEVESKEWVDEGE